MAYRTDTAAPGVKGFVQNTPHKKKAIPHTINGLSCQWPPRSWINLTGAPENPRKPKQASPLRMIQASL